MKLFSSRKSNHHFLRYMNTAGNNSVKAQRSYYNTISKGVPLSSLSSSRQLFSSSSHHYGYSRGRQHVRIMSQTTLFSTQVSQDLQSTSHTRTSLQNAGVLDEQNLLQFNTLHELQENACIAFADNPIYGTAKSTSVTTSLSNNQSDENSDPNVTFDYMTYSEYGDKVKHCRSILKDLGVKEFSKVGIISNNRWEWPTIAAAAYSLNATLVPMYEAQRPSDWTYIVNDAECAVLFCSSPQIYDTVQSEVLPQTPSVKASICLDASMGEPYAFSTHMEQASKVYDPDFDSKFIPSPSDLANLIYTSGTTGMPKGVELMHSNTVSNIHGIRGMATPNDVSLAFLPFAHSYGQTCELWTGMAHGGATAICRGIPFILEDLQLVNPTILLAVPTLYKKVYDGVKNLIKSSSPLKKRLMETALVLGRKRVEEERGLASMTITEKMSYAALNKIVLEKIRGRFGSRLRCGFVAGAACPPEVINFFDDIGIPICEGYGLTETSPIIVINRPEDRQPGSVGKPIHNVNVVIMGENGFPLPPGEEGEICCYGPNVMRGYHNKPEATEEVMSLAPDGKSRLFHTGDLGSISKGGWVKVTGRLKEQYKLENGKYICPTPIEEVISMSRYVMQVVLCGANRPYNVALIVPEWETIRSDLEIDETVSDDDLVNDSRVKSLIHSDVAERCNKMKKFEVPREYALVAPFTSANNMLTPKMSIRRHMVVREYQDVISSLYDNDAFEGEEESVSEDSRVA